MVNGNLQTKYEETFLAFPWPKFLKCSFLSLYIYIYMLFDHCFGYCQFFVMKHAGMQAERLMDILFARIYDKEVDSLQHWPFVGKSDLRGEGQSWLVMK